MKRKSSRSSIEFALCVFVVMALMLGFGASVSLAQEDDATEKPKKKPDVEMLECKVKVVDPDGHPIEDAIVYCTGIRSKEEPGSHWGWRDGLWGKVPKIKTDPDGIATMPYPKMLSDDKTTGTMTWTVEHPDFSSYRHDHSVDDDPAKIELERGFRIALTAVDEAGEKIKEQLYAVGSFEGGGKWEVKKNGTLVSNVMKKQDGILRVVCFREDQPTLFSEEIEIKPGDKSRVLLKDVKLALGCRVEGRLDDSVTRPIKNGYIIASISKKLDPNNWQSQWHWSDEATVAEDGTFVFESLPPNEALQMIPICDGWVPAKPKVKDVLAALSGVDPDRVKSNIEAFAATPQVVKIGETKSVANLSMVKAGTVTLKVVDKNGDPLAGVKAGSSPNQFWFNSGSQILGDSYPTRSMWELQQRGEDLMTFYKSKKSRYYGETDSEGIMRMKNMPPGWQRLVAYHEGLEMRSDPRSGRPEKRINMRGKDRRVTIQLHPKGSLPKTETMRETWNKLTELFEFK